jgi:GAF domain-containing protein
MPSPPAASVALTALLDCLANDASPAEYEARIDDLLAAVPDAELPETIAEAARRAHQTVQHRRQRESRLAALYEVARDLVALRDVDSTLHAVVEYARQVLPGADATYLCLRDHSTGGFRVLASAGLISVEFSHVEVPPGRGMAARIERTRTAQRVEHYLSATTFDHDRDLDAALGADGLSSVVGAPLVARGEVIGVLYAANRCRRRFTDEEAALTTELAEIAASAVDGAYLFEQATEARRAGDADITALRRSADLHARLVRLVVRGAGIAEVADALADVFHGHLMLLDRDDSLLAYRGHLTAVDPHLLRDVAESRRTGRVVARSGSAPPRLVAAVGTGTTFLGALVLARPEPLGQLGPMESHDLGQAAQILTMLALRQEAIIEAEEQVRGELLGELLAHHTPPTEATKLRARARNLDLSRPHVTLVVRVGAESEIAVVRRRVIDLARTEDGIAGDHGGLLVVILPGENANDLAAWLHLRIRREVDAPVVVCAVPPVDPRTGGLAERFAEARRGVRLLLALGRDDAHTGTEDLSLYGVLFDPSRAAELRRFLDCTLGPLLRHDREQGTELAETLTVFFDSGCNSAETARRMYVHVNTITKRLDRVATLLGADWQSGPGNLSCGWRSGCIICPKRTDRARCGTTTPERAQRCAVARCAEGPAGRTFRQVFSPHAQGSAGETRIDDFHHRSG